VVTYLFLGLFALLIGYFVYFQTVLSPDVINNPYNSRQEAFAKRVIRGNILASDGTVLAETVVSEDGTESRSYPYGRVFAHVVGYSTRGRTGIEALANFHLLTSHAFLGEQILNEIREEKNMGDQVVTTLDVTLQQTAYEALGNHRGAAVVLEPATGKVLAMVSKPDYDPNRIKQDWESFTVGEESASVLYNRASQGLYAPGSTFKILTLLEYMREKGNPTKFRFDCQGSLTEGNYTIHCYGKQAHGEEDLRTAFAKSCNTAFASMGLTLNRMLFEDTCQSLLFNRQLPLVIPYSESSFSLEENTSSAQQMMTAIGQGETLVSPFHMAMLVSSIANQGVLMEPYFIERIENYTGDAVKTYLPSVCMECMTEREADILTEYMEAVVTEGTGSALQALDFPVAGKTGTAEYSSDKSKSHAWFAGFSLTGESDIAVCVLVEEAGSGSAFAVPVAQQIFTAWKNQKND